MVNKTGRQRLASASSGTSKISLIITLDAATMPNSEVKEISKPSSRWPNSEPVAKRLASI